MHYYIPDRWQNPKSFTRLAHCVPLPDVSRSGHVNRTGRRCPTCAGATEDEEHLHPLMIEHLRLRTRGRSRSSGSVRRGARFGVPRLVLLDVERLGDLVDNSRHDVEVAEGALVLVTRGYEGVVVLARLGRGGIGDGSVLEGCVESSEGEGGDAEEDERIRKLVLWCCHRKRKERRRLFGPVVHRLPFLTTPNILQDPAHVLAVAPSSLLRAPHHGRPTLARNGGVRGARVLRRRRGGPHRGRRRALGRGLAPCEWRTRSGPRGLIISCPAQTESSCKTIANFHIGSRITALAWSSRVSSPSSTDDWSIE